MNSAGNKLPRRRDEARALFRNAVLDAAEAVFAERGFHGARIQDVAERARIAVGTVYNHFEDKDAVLAALLEERAGELLEATQASDDDPKAFVARLEARVTRMLAYVHDHRGFFAIATEHGLFTGGAGAGTTTKSSVRRIEKLRGMFRELVLDGVARGEIEALDEDVLVRFLGGSIRALVLAAIDEGGQDPAAQARLVVDLFLHGAGKRGKKKSRE